MPIDPAHPYAAMLRQIRKEPGGGYASLNRDQKWEWHADVYAFNRVVLGRKESPCDPDELWRDEARIEVCIRYYRTKRGDAPGAARRRHRSDNDVREGRDLINRWAQAKGFPDVDAYAAAKGIHWSEAYREHIAETLNRATIVRKAPAAHAAAAALGVTAKEFKPSSEQMAAARRDLGLDTEPV